MNGNPVTLKNLLGYLQAKSPQFYDGTRSYVSFLATCQAVHGFSYGLCALSRSFTGPNTVADYFAQNNGQSGSGTLWAMTIGGNNPLIIFFNPTIIDTSNSGMTIANEALIFHESLHGMANLSDTQLENDFSLNSDSGSSVITQYIIDNVLDSCGSI